MVGRKVAGLVEVWKDVMLLFFLFWNDIIIIYSFLFQVFLRGMVLRCLNRSEAILIDSIS